MCPELEKKERIGCQMVFHRYGAKKGYWMLFEQMNKAGLNRDSNPGPLAPKARIIPLDH